MSKTFISDENDLRDAIIEFLQTQTDVKSAITFADAGIWVGAKGVVVETQFNQKIEITLDY